METFTFALFLIIFVNLYVDAYIIDYGPVVKASKGKILEKCLDESRTKRNIRIKFILFLKNKK